MDIKEIKQKIKEAKRFQSEYTGGMQYTLAQRVIDDLEKQLKEWLTYNNPTTNGILEHKQKGI